ncbi:hypothetical protein C2G38_2190753 [Gigaspora rosea]|uniref:Uncharacterized protein n=1 Tax=Gigaspora rosea TaxID=44941 RepID=A0A397V865_9GLOM|nr:hypothetical protein C2G38_2190753 [Gigaspora rosea]
MSLTTLTLSISIVSGRGDEAGAGIKNLAWTILDNLGHWTKNIVWTRPSDNTASRTSVLAKYGHGQYRPLDMDIYGLCLYCSYYFIEHKALSPNKIHKLQLRNILNIKQN